jgi:hypothetical protein
MPHARGMLINECGGNRILQQVLHDRLAHPERFQQLHRVLMEIHTSMLCDPSILRWSAISSLLIASLPLVPLCKCSNE